MSGSLPVNVIKITPDLQVGRQIGLNNLQFDAAAAKESFMVWGAGAEEWPDLS